MEYRIEHDSMGELQVSAKAQYQAQTQRAVQKFQLHPSDMPQVFIRALLLIKQTAAAGNQQLGQLSEGHASAIIAAAVSQLCRIDQAQYPVSVYQTGSGTNSNMNEVLATVAIQLAGGENSP